MNQGAEKYISQMAYETPKQVKLTQQLLEIYRSSRSSWDIKAKEDDDFRRGDQLSKKAIFNLKQKRQSPVIHNVIESAVENAKAMLTANKPAFSATAKEDSDRKTGKVFADLMSHIWNGSDGNMHLKTAVDDYYVKGMGVLFTYVDPHGAFGKGEIMIESLDPFDVFIDPNSKDPYARDAAHIIISKILSFEQIQDIYPDKKELLKFVKETFQSNQPISGRNIANQDSITENYHKKAEALQRYSKIKVTEINVFNKQTGNERIFSLAEFQEFLQDPCLVQVSQEGEQWITADQEVEQALQIYEQTGGVFHYEQNPQTGEPEMAPGPENQYSIPGSTVELVILPMSKAIEAGILLTDKIVQTKIQRIISIGGVLFDESVMPISNYPIVTIMNHHNRTPYPMSDVRLVKGLQEQINKIESLIVAHASNSTNVKLLIPQGSVDRKKVEEEWQKAGTAVIEFNAEIGNPIVVQPPALPNELYKNKADKMYEIERMMGIFAMQQGDASQAPNTFKGTVQLDEFGQRRIKSKRDDIEGAINTLAKVVVNLIQKVYTEPRAIRLLQPNNLPTREVSINQPMYSDFGDAIGKINDVTVGAYDLIVVTGSMLPSNRWAMAEYYKELYGAGLIDQQEFLMKTEVADVEGVLERSGQMNQMQQALQQAQDQIKKLEGDMQTLQRENVHLEKKVEVEKFKTGLNENRSDVNKASQLYEARLNDELAMQKRTMQMNNKVTMNNK